MTAIRERIEGLLWDLEKDAIDETTANEMIFPLKEVYKKIAGTYPDV